MRGLDTRVLLAKARIMSLIDKDKADEMMMDVWMEAFGDGSTDAFNGIYTPPMQFSDEPKLLQWWRDGQEFYLLNVEMNDCSGCNSHRGEPCHIHG